MHIKNLFYHIQAPCRRFSDCCDIVQIVTPYGNSGFYCLNDPSVTAGYLSFNNRHQFLHGFLRKKYAYLCMYEEYKCCLELENLRFRVYSISSSVVWPIYIQVIIHDSCNLSGFVEFFSVICLCAIFKYLGKNLFKKDFKS